MKFKVEVDDFWLDEDDDLGATLKHHVTRDVLGKIKDSIEEKVEEQLTKKIIEVVNGKLEGIIDSKLDELLATGVVTHRGEDIKISNLIKRHFENNNGWNSPDDKIQDMAKEFGKELRGRYDAVFATHIVMNMKEQGLLKDDVAQMLIGGGSKDENQ